MFRFETQKGFVMKQVMLINGDFLSADTEEELEDKVWEEVERHVTVVHGGENLNPEHSQLVEAAFDQTMATMEDTDAQG